MTKRLVFLDRDGTVIVNKHYQKDPEETELFPGAREALRDLRGAGFGLVLVSNQSGIARGYLTEDDLAAINARLCELLGGDVFVRMDHCPHGPDDGCDCRKPATGMLVRAAEAVGADLTDCYMIGDSEADIRVGQAVGATTVLVLTGYGEKTRDVPGLRADYVASDLADAARWIVGRSENGRNMATGPE